MGRWIQTWAESLPCGKLRAGIVTTVSLLSSFLHFSCDCDHLAIFVLLTLDASSLQAKRVQSRWKAEVTPRGAVSQQCSQNSRIWMRITSSILVGYLQDCDWSWIFMCFKRPWGLLLRRDDKTMGYHISPVWSHACLFCFWVFWFYLIHQGVLNVPFAEIPRTPDLQSLHQSHSFLSTWTKLSSPQFRTLPALHFFWQTDARQQSSIAGSWLCLLAWGPYILSLFGLHPTQAARLQRFDKAAWRAAQGRRLKGFP